jgi:glycosyltransferase involved in cell wall biosynthesis
MDKIKKIKICVFTIHPVKDLRIFNRQCHSFVKQGWEVTLIGISEKEGEYYDDGVKVIGIKKWKSGWGRAKTVFRIAYLAYKQKSDIYHFHDFDLLIPAVFVKFFSCKPIIYDIHEFYRINIPYRRLPNIWPLRQIASVFIWLIETFFGLLCGNISGVCEKLIRRFEKLGCRTVLTTNFASIEDFVPIEISDELWEQRHKKVIFTGTLDPSKGSLILLDIAKETRKRCPDIEFYVTGRFLSSFQEETMMKKMSSKEYKDVIRFIPNVSGKELPQVVRQGGIALSPIQDVGQNQIAIPTKFFEYMSQAVPIIASDLPPSRKFVSSEGCGILVKADVVEQYVDAIIKLADNPELAREMGRKGQRAFVEKYNWSIVEKRLLAFYDSIMKKQI